MKRQPTAAFFNEEFDNSGRSWGVRIFFWTILVVLTLSLSFLCILLDSCRPR